MEIEFNGIKEFINPWNYYWDVENKRVYSLAYAFDGTHCGYRDLSDREWESIKKSIPKEEPKRYVYIKGEGNHGLIKKIEAAQ